MQPWEEEHPVDPEQTYLSSGQGDWGDLPSHEHPMYGPEAFQHASAPPLSPSITNPTDLDSDLQRGQVGLQQPILQLFSRGLGYSSSHGYSTFDLLQYTLAGYSFSIPTTPFNPSHYGRH